MKRHHHQRAGQEQWRRAQSLLRLGRRFAAEGLTSQTPVSPLVFSLRFGIHEKSIDHYGAVLLLLSQGHIGSAYVVTRALLEAALAQEFLSRRTVRLQRGDGVRKKPIELHGKQLTAQFRAELYEYHTVAEQHRYFRLAPPGSKFDGFTATLRSIEAVKQELASGIGAEWSRRIEEKKSYTGLSLRELAYSLGNLLGYTYDALYRMHCKFVHAADAAHYVNVDHVERTMAATSAGDADDRRLILGQSMMLFSQQLSRFARTFDVAYSDKLRLLKLMQKMYVSDD